MGVGDVGSDEEIPGFLTGEDDGRGDGHVGDRGSQLPSSVLKISWEVVTLSSDC